MEKFQLRHAEQGGLPAFFKRQDAVVFHQHHALLRNLPGCADAALFCFGPGIVELSVLHDSYLRIDI